MPVYKDTSKKNNPWWYEFPSREKKPSGKFKPIRKRGFASKKEAEQAMVEAQNEYNKGLRIEPTKMTYGDYLVNEWFPNRTDLGSQTRNMYESYIKTHIVGSEMAQQKLHEMNALHVQRFVNELNAKNLASATVKKIYNIVNTSLKGAHKLKLVKENVAPNILNKPKGKKRNKVDAVWDDHEVKEFLHKTKDMSRYSVIFHIALYTGMRQGEILGLRWKDVDLDNGVIRITQTLSHDGKHFNTGKTNNALRTVAIDDVTVKKLRKHKALMAREKLSGQYKFHNDLVFVTRTGNLLLPRSLLDAYDICVEKSGMKKITFHDLRHTHASLLLKAGVNSKIVSERLGHASVQLTLDLYSHLLPNMQDEAVKKLRDMLGE